MKELGFTLHHIELQQNIARLDHERALLENRKTEFQQNMDELNNEVTEELVKEKQEFLKLEHELNDLIAEYKRLIANDDSPGADFETESGGEGSVLHEKHVIKPGPEAKKLFWYISKHCHPDITEDENLHIIFHNALEAYSLNDIGALFSLKDILSSVHDIIDFKGTPSYDYLFTSLQDKHRELILTVDALHKEITVLDNSLGYKNWEMWKKGGDSKTEVLNSFRENLVQKMMIMNQNVAKVRCEINKLNGLDELIHFGIISSYNASWDM